MDRKWVMGCWKLGLASSFCAGGAIAFFGENTHAQIVPDATLPVNSTAKPEGNTLTITGGTKAGGNLFHSFKEFSVPTGGTAYFNNPTDIQNILTRVTGGSISNIDGLLKANGTANLFLLNPNGIIFGPNAQLNIGGSFLASTASAVKFADGAEFSARELPSTPLLTVSVPVGLQFGANPGSILVQGQGHNFTVDPDISEIIRTDSPTGLAVKPGKTLALVGGDVRLEGGTLQAPAGRVELGGLAGTGTVGINSDSSLSFPAESVENMPAPRADVSLHNRARIDVKSGGGGSIGINARNLEMSGGSILSAGIGENLVSPGVQAGNIDINATDKATIAGASPAGFFSVITNQVGTGQVGNGGNINIRVEALSVSNGAILTTSSFGQGNAGNITIDARDAVSLVGQRPFTQRDTDKFSSGAFSRSQAGAIGNAGSIYITARSLDVKDGALLSASSLGQGNAGNITIHARDTVLFDGEGGNFFSSGAFSRIRGGAKGQPGNIAITARSLYVTNGAYVTVSTNGEGDGGNILVNATDSVTVSGFGIYDGTSSGLYTQTELGAFGQGGRITLNTSRLRVENGAIIDAETVRGTNGGSITINAKTFEALNGGQVFTTTRSSGQAGNIIINAAESVTLSGSDPNFAERLNLIFSLNLNQNSVLTPDILPNQGPASGLFSNTSKDSTGAGGNLTVQTGRLIARDGAQITVSSDGSGGAGNLKITADSIRLDNGAIRATTQSGNFGNITLQTRDLQMRRNSQINTDATGTGGNIAINAKTIAALENSDITANSVDSRGGRVIINSQGIFGTEFRDKPNDASSDITATSDLGREFNGIVEINTPDVNPTSGLLNLPENLVDAATLIDQRCSTRNPQRSEFIVSGRGGKPPSPIEEPLSSNLGWSDSSSANAPSAVTELPSQSRGDRIVEAQGWTINAKGQVELVAEASTVTPYSSWLTPPACATRSDPVEK